MNGDKDNEILTAHALGALDAEEARAIQARLDADPQLRAEFENWREAVGLLALAADAAEPAPEMRVRILEKIRRTPQNSGGSEPEKNGFAPENIKPQPLSNVVQFAPRKSHSAWSYVSTVGAIAASIIAVVLAFSLFNQMRRTEEKTAQLAELNQRLSQAEQKLSGTQAQLDQIRQEREMLGSPATIIAALNGVDGAPQARARLVFDQQTGKAMFFVEGLPEAPRGKAYQVWFILDPQHPAPGATFGTDAAGKAVLRNTMPNEVLKAKTFAVTLEPEGGSPAPTGQPFLKGSAL